MLSVVDGVTVTYHPVLVVVEPLTVVVNVVQGKVGKEIEVDVAVVAPPELLLGKLLLGTAVGVKIGVEFEVSPESLVGIGTHVVLSHDDIGATVSVVQPDPVGVENPVQSLGM